VKTSQKRGKPDFLLLPQCGARFSEAPIFKPQK